MEVEAKRPFQFSCWNQGGSWAKAWLTSFYDLKTRLKAKKAYSEGLVMASNPQLQGIRHYHKVGVYPRWAKGHRPVVRVGSHLFYEGIR